MILDLRQQGLSVSAIARRLGIDRKTVRRYFGRSLRLALTIGRLVALSDAAVENKPARSSQGGHQQTFTNEKDNVNWPKPNWPSMLAVTTLATSANVRLPIRSSMSYSHVQ